MFFSQQMVVGKVSCNYGLILAWLVPEDSEAIMKSESPWVAIFLNVMIDDH